MMGFTSQQPVHDSDVELTPNRHTVIKDDNMEKQIKQCVINDNVEQDQFVKEKNSLVTINVYLRSPYKILCTSRRDVRLCTTFLQQLVVPQCLSIASQ